MVPMSSWCVLVATITSVGVYGVLAFRGSAAPRRADLRLPSGATIRVEVANTPVARSRGLSGRDRLDGDGLLLEWPDVGQHPMWMSGMRLPLDIVWLDDAGVALAVEQGAQPCVEPPCPLLNPETADRAKAVLEIGAGRAGTLGLTPGGRILAVGR